MIIVMAVMLWSKNSLRQIPPRCIGKKTVLKVASKISFLAKGDGVLPGINSPSQQSPEEKWSIVSNLNLLIKVILEEFLWLCTTHNVLILLIIKKLIKLKS